MVFFYVSLSNKARVLSNGIDTGLSTVSFDTLFSISRVVYLLSVPLPTVFCIALSTIIHHILLTVSRILSILSLLSLGLISRVLHYVIYCLPNCFISSTVSFVVLTTFLCVGLSSVFFFIYYLSFCLI